MSGLELLPDFPPDLDLSADPYAGFRAWYALAEANCPQPEAMTLATADAVGRPAARMVLFRGFSGERFNGEGLRFFGNHDSRKGRDLAANPHAALLFYWQALRRQVRVEGAVKRLERAEAEAYFATRDRESQVGSHASQQSQPVAGRGVLEARVIELEQRFADQEVPMPVSWGGYRLMPDAFEFWHNRPHRLHDRFRYERGPSGWSVTRLYP